MQNIQVQFFNILYLCCRKSTGLKSGFCQKTQGSNLEIQFTQSHEAEDHFQLNTMEIDTPFIQEGRIHFGSLYRSPYSCKKKKEKKVKITLS